MKLIKTEDGYRRAVKRIDTLVLRRDAETNDELELLTILVMAYESEHVPDVPMEPMAYLKTSMDKSRAHASRSVASSRLHNPRRRSAER